VGESSRLTDWGMMGAVAHKKQIEEPTSAAKPTLHSSLATLLPMSMTSVLVSATMTTIK